MSEKSEYLSNCYTFVCDLGGWGVWEFGRFHSWNLELKWYKFEGCFLVRYMYNKEKRKEKKRKVNKIETQICFWVYLGLSQDSLVRHVNECQIEFLVVKFHYHAGLRVWIYVIMAGSWDLCT